MKISNSKRQLAQLLIEAGVTQFPEGANWAAQDKCGVVHTYERRPVFKSGGTGFGHGGGDFDFIFNSKKITNWHQAVLSRAEFDQIVAETAQDADGWIKCSSDELPVPYGTMIDVKYSDGDELHGAQCGVCTFGLTSIRGEYASAESFEKGGDFVHIIAYRPHKPELAKSTLSVGDRCKIADMNGALGRVTAIDSEGSDFKYQVKLDSGLIAWVYDAEPSTEPHQIAEPKATLDQLLQDWRNADDYAQRKQAEADEAAAMRDERWQAVQARAGEINVTVERISP